jgi:hypothetical protein
MKPPDSAPVRLGSWTSLWVVALVSLLAQLGLCQFFSFGGRVPVSLDVNPSNLWKMAYHFPPTGTFRTLNWLGTPYLPQSLQPFSLAASNLSPWWFFTTYAPVMATLGLLGMAAFLRELELSRPAAVFGGVIFAWQGDLLPFVYPGHYAYIATWPFFAIAAWGALRCERTGRWAYAVISGVSCGLMVSLQPDRGGIASTLIGALFIAAIAATFRRSPPFRSMGDFVRVLMPLPLCVAVAALVALAPLLALFQSNIEGVTIAGVADREQTYKLVTQFSLAPVETLTYLVPGLFGWHMNSAEGIYWGWIGEWPDWGKHHEGSRNLNLAISTTGTIATVLALIGAGLLAWDEIFGPSGLTERQKYYGRVLLVLGLVALVLSWGWHTPFYRPLFALPLMDKWRNPLKWLEMTNFALVVLSAMGLEHLLASLDTETPGAKVVRPRLAWLTLGMTILLALGFALTYPVAVVLAVALPKEGFDPSVVPGIMSTFHTSAFCALAMMALLCVVLRALWRPEPMRGWKLVNPLMQRAWQRMLLPENLPVTLALTLAALAALQLGWVANQFIQPISIDELTTTNPLLDALRAEGNTVRCSVAVQDPILNDLLQNQFAAMDISCLEISAASRIPNDFNTFLQTLDSNQAQLWFLAGVKNVVVPEPGLEQMKQDAGVAANIDHALGFTLVQTGNPNLPSHAMVGMKQYLAKATLVPEAELFPTDEALLARLKDVTWNPRQSVLLHPAHSLPPVAGMPAATVGGNEVGLKIYTPTQIEIGVRTMRGGFVLVNDHYDPDWKVEVNGRNAELLRADYIMRAVQVPPGDSTVTMNYVAHFHVAGFSPSVRAINNLSDGAMLAAWLIAAFALWRRKPEEIR